MRLQTFRLLLVLGTAALVFLTVRAAILGRGMSWADGSNALLFIVLLAVTYFRPKWLKALTWVGLLALFVNALGELDLRAEESATPLYILLPLFILYAALLGDLFMSLTAMVSIIGVYTATWLMQGGVDRDGTVILTNLMVLTLFSGVAALGVWLQHSRLERTLALQAKALRDELETRLRVQAMVAHDIRTPLTALVNAALLDDPKAVQEMAGRIVQITDAAQGLTKGTGITPTSVVVADVWQYTKETFSDKLLEKDQRLQTHGDSTLALEADLPILCNSIISNFLTNASKFSPRGSTVEVVAEAQGESVRIAVLDEGPGLPEDMLRQDPELPRHRSKSGTEGERGTGYGLQIAALCAARMNGRVEIGSAHLGGAISVLLPRANGSS